MATYTITVDECDLCDMAVGRFMRECPGVADQIATEGAGSFFDADERMVQVPADPWRNWHIIALSDEEGRELAKQAASRFRQVVAELTGDEDARPWRDTDE